jgi:hypothetical protein
MNFCIFINVMYSNLSDEDPVLFFKQELKIQGLTRVSWHTPLQLEQNDPYLENKGAPDLILQLYFNDISSAECALTESTPLVTWLTRLGSDCTWTHQIMSVRSIMPRQAQERNGDVASATYMVGYQTSAKEGKQWVDAYLQKHPQLMVKLPEVTEVEIYTCVDYFVSTGVREEFIQRNKVVFPSPELLSASLVSETRKELRNDFLSLPKIPLHTPHYPMNTTEIVF